MPIFECGSCQKRIKVPDSYAGKRVRCPGCSSAQRVPDVVNEAALDAFASLDADGEVAARSVREILIGCGPCGKSIRLKEHQLGRAAPCPACGTLLSVDAFKLPKPGKRGGGLLDMSHLELDAADPLLGGRGFPDSGGSTMGGTHVHMADGSSAGASASGYALTGLEDPTTLGGGAGDSQTQMRELRELNDLKHSGGISDAEYRQRKKDIYAGKSLAIQAMSRATDGSSNPAGRMPTGRDKPLLPGPVKALIALVVLGVGGYVVWDNVLAPDSGRQATTPSVAAPVVIAPTPTKPAPEEAVEAAPVVKEIPETPVVEVAPEPEPMPEVVEEVQPVEPEIDPNAPWVVTEWDIRNSEETRPDPNLPLGRACSHVRKIETRNGSATAGVAVGPAAETMDDPAYVAFRDEQYALVELAAEAKGLTRALNFEKTEKPVRVGRQVVDRLTVEHKTQRGALAAVLTLVQDGRATAYWFEGEKLAYRSFVNALGTASLMSAAEVEQLEAEEAAREALF